MEKIGLSDFSEGLDLWIGTRIINFFDSFLLKKKTMLNHRKKTWQESRRKKTS